MPTKQWRLMAKCSRHATQRRRTRGHQSSYDTKMVWQRADVDEDRSLFLVSTSATGRSSLARYGGAVPCRHRKTRTESLNSIRSGTHSQWRSRSSACQRVAAIHWLNWAGYAQAACWCFGTASLITSLSLSVASPRFWARGGGHGMCVHEIRHQSHKFLLK